MASQGVYLPITEGKIIDEIRAAERAADQRGQERMRERAAQHGAQVASVAIANDETSVGHQVAKAIRALAPEEP